MHRLSIGPLAAPAQGGVLAAPEREKKALDSAHDNLVASANAGNAEANYSLGLKYLAGDGVRRDFVEAFARIRLAAEAGHPRAISLFYSIGAHLTAKEHAQAYLRSQELRPAASASR